MSQSESLGASTAFTQQLGGNITTFVQEHRLFFQAVGLGLLAITAGAVTGVAVAKGLAASKGATFIPVTFSTGSTLANQLSTLFSTVNHNLIPLTAGAAGGGAAGVAVSQRQVRGVKARLIEQIAQTETFQAETSRLQALLTTAETQLKTWQVASSPRLIVPDALERIHGIGSTFARKLNEAGIHTFADLAAQTPEQVEAIIGSARTKRLVNPQAWIDQARQLAEESNRGISTL